MLTVTLHACVCVHARMSTPAPVRLRLSELPSLQISYLFFFCCSATCLLFFQLAKLLYFKLFMQNRLHVTYCYMLGEERERM